METLNSEHHPLLTNYKYSISYSINNKHNLKWNFNKANWEGFLKDCDQVINIYNNINTFNTELTEQIIKIASNNIPQTKPMNKPNPVHCNLNVHARTHLGKMI